MIGRAAGIKNGVLQGVINVEFRLNNQKVWDMEALEFYRDNGIAYDFNSEIYNDLKNKILKKEMVLRNCSGNNLDFYDIYVNEEFVGEIWTSKTCILGEIELLIGIRKQGNGYAKEAIKMFIASYLKENETIYCSIKEENPNKEKISKILKELAFKKGEINDFYYPELSCF